MAQFIVVWARLLANTRAASMLKRAIILSWYEISKIFSQLEVLPDQAEMVVLFSSYDV